MKLKVKGINDGILMILPEKVSWEDCCASVRETIGDNTAFFSGANLFLDVHGMDIRVIEITNFRDEMTREKISLKGIFSSSEKTMQNCRSLGLLTEASVTQKILRKKTAKEGKSEYGLGETAYLISKTVRSGTSVTRKENIIIDGDVNPGAEVSSEKNVIVLGRVRGRISAGSFNDTGSWIGAFGFENAQVIINGILSFVEKAENKNGHAGLCIIRNNLGEIQIDAK